MADARIDDDVGRVAGQAGAGDPILQNIQRRKHHAEQAGMVRLSFEDAMQERGTPCLGRGLMLFVQQIEAGHGLDLGPGAAVHADDIGIEIHRDGHLRPHRHPGRDRHGIDQRAIDQPAMIDQDRREDAGKRE